MLGKVRYESKYLAIQYFHTEKNWSIGWMSKQLEISRAAYYKWLHREIPEQEKENIKLFINLIILALKDMFHVKQNEKAVFCNHVEFFDSLTYDNNDIIKKIELLLETSYLLDTNANIPLLMDSMMYRI